jgi:ABC-type phosphate/phosphonate transport system substrate-binding protein
MRFAVGVVLACSLLGLLLWAGDALAALNFDQSDVKTLSNCATDGATPAAVTLTANKKYLMTVTGEDTTVCFAATCSTGGSIFPASTVIEVGIGNATTSVTCRSAGAAGDVEFTRVN